jgi:diguanylate cyclase (GGDEF)-like protein
MAIISDAATTASTARTPFPHKSLMRSPDLADNNCWDELSAASGAALRAMGSFKLKLVAWFALLALLPLGIAFYGYDQLARRSEARRVDTSLNSALRSAVAGYATRLDGAAAQATQLARDRRLQRALRGHDVATLAQLIRGVPNSYVRGAGIAIGRKPAASAVRTVTVVEGDRILGRVSVVVPIDRSLLTRLGAGLDAGDHLVAVQHGRILTGVGHGQPLDLRAGRVSRVRIGASSYQGLVTAPLSAPEGLSFAALAPHAAAKANARSSEQAVLVALLGSLVLFAAVTYVLGRSIVTTLRRLGEAAGAIASGELDRRVEVRGRDEFAQLGAAFNDMTAQLEQRHSELDQERERVRRATGRLGEALVATHDPRQLLKVVVESAVEGTGADGGIVIGRDGELVRAGNPDGAGERIAFPLRAGASDFGHLVIVSHSFDAGQIDLARALASQAVVALDNVQLHRLVQYQALVDSLTGLANRRSLDDSLRFELARAGRFGGDVCLIIADLDDFKHVNDRYGHPFGDVVLQEFANVLRATARETDVAARWGGEEFALVLPGTDADGGVEFAERVRQIFEAQANRAADGLDVQVTASFGVAAFPEAAGHDALIEAADGALYAAKRAGKNRVRVARDHVAPHPSQTRIV